MMEVPSTPWRAAPWDAAEARAAVPELVSLGDEWRALPGVVRHTFTHFHFEVTVWAAQAMDVPAAAGRWLAPDAFADAAVPTVMRTRSEERRVGKECVSTCRSRWSPSK